MAALGQANEDQVIECHERLAQQYGQVGRPLPAGKDRDTA